ncbi:Zinc finger MYM-type protein 6 [Holothuria leucospilota]|uniref:Zinc finger MYM-type protein 6 n=1 Tax=Holothuria leucospilota TaxID=206669 RepID=A0A9Q1H4N2_HOLLE|nr:Zinc finger MYM-type protein 6 [Holothuria leucospilota]
MQRFKEEYTRKWPIITESTVDVFHAFCTKCQVNFSISHGGLNDIAKHVGSAKHRQIAMSVQEHSGRLHRFFASDRSTEGEQVIRAEVLFSDFIVEHNLPIAVADRVGPLLRKMFPDSETAKKYGCARTKTTAILGVSAEENVNEIVKHLINNPFSVATDGSNDYADHKLYPVLVKYFDYTEGRVICCLLSVKECKVSSTGKNIFDLLDNTLQRYKIPWRNCICFGTDNASVMVGHKSGVAAFLKEANSDIYIQGCPCHLMHLTAEKASKELLLNVEEFLIDIYYYLDKSAKRKQELQAFQTLCGLESRKILKHVSTRWLSLGLSVKRVLEQWNALKDYFNKEVAKKEPCSSKSKQGSNKDPQKSKVMRQQGGGSHAGSTTHKESSQDHGKTTLARPQEVRPHAGNSGTTAPKQKREGPQRLTSAKSHSVGSQASVLTTAATHGHKSKDPERLSLSRPKERGTDTRDSAPRNKQGSKKGSENSTKRRPQEVASCAGSSTNKQPQHEFDVASYLFKQAELSKQYKARREKEASNVPSGGDGRVFRVHRHLQDGNAYLTMLFLDAVLPVFDKANILLQSDEPLIHKLLPTLQKQLINILTNLVKPSVIKNYQNNLLDIPFDNLKSQKEDKDLFIGAKAEAFLEECSTVEAGRFYRSVRNYYSKAIAYMINKFPYKDPLLYHAQAADISKQMDTSFESVRYFTNRYDCFSLSEDDMDLLQREFNNYQVFEFPESVLSKQRIDEQWHQIGLLRDENEQLRFPKLAYIMQGVITMFHSNSDCERIFSYVTKTATSMRPNLGSSTLSNLMVHKQFMLAKQSVCHKQKYSSSFLTKAKKATYEKLRKGNGDA